MSEPLVQVRNLKTFYPIKVNQQRHIVEEFLRNGKEFGFGLEAGSKPELMAVLASAPRGAAIVCNGYKDAEFIDLGLFARRMGYACFFVLESLHELQVIIERSRKLQIEPLIGVRMKSAVKVDGHWKVILSFD